MRAAAKNQTGRVREYIDDYSGILELPKTRDGRYPSVYFHADCVFVPNPSGNPYGPPVRFSEVRGASLRELLQMGVDLQIDTAEIDNRYFGLLATAVWPRTTESPSDPGVVSPVRLWEHLHDFMDQLEECGPVWAAVHGLSAARLRPASAKVWELFDDDFGAIELKLTEKNVRFICLFHREDVYLKDGKHAVEHEFFKVRSGPLKTQTQNQSENRT